MASTKTEREFWRSVAQIMMGSITLSGSAPQAPVQSSQSYEALSMLIGLLYDAATDEEAWAEFLSTAADIFGAAHAELRSDAPVEAGGFSVSHNIDPAAVAQYDSYYRYVDPWRAASPTPAPGTFRVLRGERLVSDSALLRSEFYRQFLRRYGVRWFLGCHLGSVMPRAGTYTLVFFRGPDSAPFEPHLDGLLSKLAPHLQRIERLGAMLTYGQASLREERTAVFFRSGRGRFLQCNEAGERLITRGLIQEGARALQITTMAANLWLHGLLRTPGKFLGSPGAVSTTERLDDDGEFTIELLPLTPRPGVPALRAAEYMLLIRPVIRVDTSELAKRAQSVYGWTASEFEITSRIGAGRTVEQIASDRGVSVLTVRSHIKNAKRKAGVRRSLDLVRLVIELAQ